MENIPESLVNMRAGFSQLERRGGIRYSLNEIKFQKKLLDINFINYHEFIRNILTRITVRMMPNNFRQIIYKLIRKKD
jgi:UDP-Gal:alpha-D-GlcNAc-diphosphoundecaprenol beta-1,3-galactosyltransferase